VPGADRKSVSLNAPDRCELLCLDLPKAEAVRAARLEPEALRAAAERAKALGDPTRLQVALALREGGELCVCDLAWVCGRSDRLVSHHARALRARGPRCNPLLAPVTRRDASPEGRA
jgi:hypothetical protein